jgi:hypothetical protein
MGLADAGLFCFHAETELGSSRELSQILDVAWEGWTGLSYVEYKSECIIQV